MLKVTFWQGDLAHTVKEQSMPKSEETRSLFAETYERRKEEMTAKVVIKSGDQGQPSQAGETKMRGQQAVLPAPLDAVHYSPYC